tara:strand:+ start:309 stop:1979 length:1671 start_codon:yes stop_codon:yes gene_type:complete
MAKKNINKRRRVARRTIQQKVKQAIANNGKISKKENAEINSFASHYKINPSTVKRIKDAGGKLPDSLKPKLTATTKAKESSPAPSKTTKAKESSPAPSKTTKAKETSPAPTHTTIDKKRGRDKLKAQIASAAESGMTKAALAKIRNTQSKFGIAKGTVDKMLASHHSGEKKGKTVKEFEAQLDEKKNLKNNPPGLTDSEKKLRNKFNKGNNQVDKLIQDANADGKVTPEEMTKIRNVSKRNFLPDDAVDKAFDRAASNLQAEKTAQQTTKEPVKKPKKQKDQFDPIFSDQGAIKPQDIKGKKWNPKKVRQTAEKAWQSRLKDYSADPKRLNIKVPNRPDRLKDPKYQTKGKFDADKYSADIRQKMAARYKERGGTARNAMDIVKRTTARTAKAFKPKYGGAIEGLKKQLGSINYAKKFKETTSKLAGDIKSNARNFKQLGMSILKPRRSEDAAVPKVPASLIKSSTSIPKQGTTGPTADKKTTAQSTSPRPFRGANKPKIGGAQRVKNLIAKSNDDGKTTPEELAKIRKVAKRRGLGPNFVNRQFKNQGRNLQKSK